MSTHRLGTRCNSAAESLRRPRFQLLPYQSGAPRPRLVLPLRQRCRRLAVCSSAATSFPSPYSISEWPTWTALTLISIAGQVLERRTPLGRFASAPVLVMALAAATAGARLIPAACGVYDTVWSSVMPLGAVLTLLEVDLADLARLWDSVGSTAVAFVIGSVGVVAGTLLAWALLGHRLGSEGAKVAAALCASYIGGSINFAATAAALGLAPSRLAGAMAADCVAMAAYLAVISSWPVQRDNHSRVSSSAAAALNPSAEHAAAPVSERDAAERRVTMQSAVLSVAAAALACWTGSRLANALGFADGGLAVMALVATAIASAVAAVAAKQRSSLLTSPFAGATQLGAALMLPFFATLGVAAGGMDGLPELGTTFALICIQLVTHIVVIIAGGRFLGIPMDAVLTASNANVGGPATAAATASARKWTHMVQPAMLTGALGYAVGTAIGCGVWRLLL